MRLDHRTVLILFHPDGQHVFLLRRRSRRTPGPGLITGSAGGKVELERGEGDDLEQSLWREFEEETHIPRDSVRDMRLRLTTVREDRDGQRIVILHWFSGQLTVVPSDLSHTEGTLL
jgi:8-oxo-dGTP pyrophosphatase MutT (NUDIX family)